MTTMMTFDRPGFEAHVLAEDGKIVCIFRRKVMVPKNSYLEARGGEQPGRPVPQPDKNWPGPQAG